MDLKSDFISYRAKELGADLVGIAACMPLEEEARQLDQWLKLGYNGKMAWFNKNRDVRDDPGKLLEGCRSIIMIGVNYYTSHLHFRFPDFPRVSRYAWGRDYHKVLRDILKKLEDEIDDAAKQQGITNARHKVVVDSAPFREKVWAHRAGLGWIGKNSLLINRKYGSWLFLGGLLTTLELEPTSTHKYPDHCGSCHKCLDACPTKALRRPGQLDARACLSYLTVEYSGEIPPQFRDSFSGWIFGCDTCQEACPWNRFAHPARLRDFDPKPGLLIPDLKMWSQMTPDYYDKLTSGGSIRRASCEQLRRNALAVMGLL
jgi:epoxyqueuosine reductase